jgi:dephospho-CoA kinase
MGNLVYSVGLTGGIGCGKTTVLEVFKSLGIPCFNSDDEAKKYYDDAIFCQQVAERFGHHVLRLDGSVDRKAIAAVVFNNPCELHWLNSQLHPRVMTDFHEWKIRCNDNIPYVILESAILYESHLDKEVDFVVDVYLEKEERLRRLELRDHVSRDLLEARMANQMNEEEKRDRADFVIHNYEGNPRREQVLAIHRQLLGKREAISPERS